MKPDAVIKTQKIEAKNPFTAFLLSLVCTGLGQAYNADMAKGAAFAIMRCLAFFLIPFFSLKQEADSIIHIFIALTLICVVISLASSIESLFYAARNRKLPLKAYNSMPGYGLFASVNLILTGLAVAILCLFFSIDGISDKRAGPLIEPGDYVLIKRYSTRGSARGDLVLLDDGSAVRIMAVEGDSVGYAGNMFSINGRDLPLGFLPDDLIQTFTPDRGDIVSETNGGKKYPVRFKRSTAISLQNLASPVARGYMLVAADQRLEKNFARIIPAGGIRGRIEGILFSSNMRKIGMDFCADLLRSKKKAGN